MRRLIPVRVAQHPGHSHFGLSVDFEAYSWADLGGVDIALTCSCPFARGNWTGHVSVCLPFRLGQRESFWPIIHMIYTWYYKGGLGF